MDMDWAERYVSKDGFWNKILEFFGLLSKHKVYVYELSKPLVVYRFDDINDCQFFIEKVSNQGGVDIFYDVDTKVRIVEITLR